MNTVWSCLDNLGGDTLGRFLPFSLGQIIFPSTSSCRLSCTPSAFEKRDGDGGYSEGKDLLLGSKFFPFRIDNTGKNFLTESHPHMYPFPLMKQSNVHIHIIYCDGLILF